MVDEREAFAAAQRLRVVFTAVLILTLGLVVAAAVSGVSSQADMVAAATGLVGWDVPPLRQWQEVALAAMGFVHLGFWVALLWVARTVVAQFGKGELAQAARAAKKLAYILWALFVWVILAGAIGSVVVTWHMPPGERTLAIGLSSMQISLALAALITGFMAKTFALCAELWHDYNEVI